jgi:hypothetical protein
VFTRYQVDLLDAPFRPYLSDLTGCLSTRLENREKLGNFMETGKVRKFHKQIDKNQNNLSTFVHDDIAEFSEVELMTLLTRC